MKITVSPRLDEYIEKAWKQAQTEEIEEPLGFWEKHKKPKA
jgi:hypothetical protein